MSTLEKLEEELEAILTDFTIDSAVAQRKIADVYNLSMSKLEKLEKLIEEIKNERKD